MNYFKFLKKVCLELDGLITKLSWGQRDDEGRIHWLAWHKVTKAKKNGGISFRDFENFSDALLAKKVWRLISNPNEMWARKLKGIYFPNSDFFEAGKGSRASWCWSSLLEGRKLLLKKLSWRIGNGENDRIWGGRWIPSLVNDCLGAE